MVLLPLRALPAQGAHDGPFTMRVDIKPSGSAYVFVRRESDKKTWLCTVRTLQEILAPSQQARSLDFAAVVMCLYNGVAYDSSAGVGYATGPVELRRREVAYSQPETWTDDGYRLTMRVCVRSTAIATPMVEPVSNEQAPIAAIPVVDVAEDDVVFGLNFAPTDVSIDYTEINVVNHIRRRAKLDLLETAFPNTYLQWEYPKRSYKDNFDADFLRVVNDGVFFNFGGIVHAGHALFVLSVNAKSVKATHSTSYTVGDLQHTVAHYAVKIASRWFFQVALLPGSACAVEGTTITFRELTVY